ncbi:MAG: YybS family protein [Bacillota bacterium]|jgi:uncharacterized protein YybS (DUF2232 family)
MTDFDQEQFNKTDLQQKPHPARIAMMVALAGICGLTSFLPIIGWVASLIYAIPLAIVTYRYGLRWGIIALLVVTVLLSLFSNPLSAGLLSLQNGVMGLFFGQSFRLKMGALRILIRGIVLAVALSFATLLISALMAGFTPLLMYETYVTAIEQMLDTLFTEKTYQGMPAAEYKAAFLELFSRILPSLLVIYAMLIAALQYLFIVLIMRRLGHQVPKLPAFANWHLNWQLVWGFIIAVILNAVGNLNEWSLLSVITANIMYVYYPLLFICGLAFFYWLSKQLKSLALMVIIVIAAIMFFNVFVYVLLIVAIVDPIFNLREKFYKLFNREKDGGER